MLTEASTEEILLKELKEKEKHLVLELKNLCVPHGSKFKEQCPEKTAEIFYQLALLYRKYSPDKFSLIRSVGLFNAAIVRIPENVDDIRKSLRDLCSHVFQLSGAHNKNVDLLKIAETCKKMVEELRDKVKKELSDIKQHPWIPVVAQAQKDRRTKMKLDKEKICKVKHLMKMIADGYKTLMCYISDESIGIMGDPPCKYAVMGMGSLAREEITPFSDFEHAIVLDPFFDDKPENVKEKILNYFRWFTVIFHIIVTTMGETLLRFMYIPSLNDLDNGEDWFYDAFTPCGISFDGMVSFASIFPLGRQETRNKPWTTELIKSVPEMIKYLNIDVSLKNGYHLGDVLRKTCFVSGFQEVYELYPCMVLTKMKKEHGLRINEIKTTILRYAKEFDVLQLNFDFLKANTMSIKQTVYRQFTLLISLIGAYHGINSSSSFDIVEELNRRHLLHDGDRYLEYIYAICIMCEMRVRLYMSEYSQADFISKRSVLRNEQCSSACDIIYAIGDMSTFDLFHSMCKLNDELKLIFNDDLVSKKAFTNYDQATQSQVGKWSLKLSLLKYLCMHEKFIGEFNRFFDLVNITKLDDPWCYAQYFNTLSLAGRVCEMKRKTKKAIKLHKAASNFQFKPETAIINFSCKLRYARFLFDMRKIHESLQQLNLAFEVRSKYFPDNESKEVLRGFSLKSRILMGMQNRYDASLTYANLAFEGFKKLKEDHYEIAHCMNNIARLSFYQQNFDQAITQGKALLDYRLKHFPRDIYNIADSHQILGEAYYLSGDFKKAVEQFKLQSSLPFGVRLSSHPALPLRLPAINNAINIRQRCFDAAWRMEHDPTFCFEDWVKGELDDNH